MLVCFGKMKVFCFLLFVTSVYGAPNLRITGGTDASLGDYPYQVSIELCTEDKGCKHNCGGTIINNNWVLSAGHCVKTSPVYFYRVVVGTLKLSQDYPNKQYINVTDVIPHPKYNISDINIQLHDISLFKVKSPIVYSKDVQPANLPETSAEPQGNVTLTGWGAITPTGRFPDVLQTVDIPIISYEDCYNIFLQHLSQDFLNSTLSKDYSVCTGDMNVGKGVCMGDSGGPIAQNGTLIGVVSWAIQPCGTREAPSVYVKVSTHTDWINQVVNQ